MLTKNDLENIRIIVKEEAKKEIIPLKIELTQFKHEVKDDIYKYKVEIVSKIKDLQDEISLTKGYGDRLEEHDKRIIKLEDLNRIIPG